jgi:hypothetical protein
LHGFASLRYSLGVAILVLMVVFALVVGDGVELGFALMFVLLLVGIVAFMVGSVRVAQAAAAVQCIVIFRGKSLDFPGHKARSSERSKMRMGMVSGEGDDDV